MSKRRMPDLSSRLNATRWPPGSSTATVSGALLVSRPFFSAVSTMVEAWARVTVMLSSDGQSCGVRGRFFQPVAHHVGDVLRSPAVAPRLVVELDRLVVVRQVPPRALPPAPQSAP